MMISFKEKLYTWCHQRLADKLLAIDQAVAEVREAVAGETKSSAGDKYETAREMMQQEIAQQLAQRAEVQKMQEVLARILPDAVSETVVPGSLVTTDKGLFYLAVSLGKASVDDQTVFLVSAASPVGSLLLGHKAGDVVHWNGGPVRLISVV